MNKMDGQHFFYRGYFPVYGREGKQKYDPGKVSSWGDRTWTRWYHKTNARLLDDTGRQFGPTIDYIQYRVDAYVITFASTVGGQRLMMLGDFLFLQQYADFGLEECAYLITSSSDKIQLDDIVRSDSTCAIKMEVPSFACKETPLPTLIDFQKSPPKPMSDEAYDAWLTEFPRVHTCASAVRIRLKEKKSEWRWLLPHPEGPRASVDRLKKTTLEDDWLALLPLLKLATPLEKSRTIASFRKTSKS